MIMNSRTLVHSLAHALRHTLAPLFVVALLLSANSAAAEHRTGWSINLTPVLLFPKGDYHFGGGGDPELKFTQDLGGARLSAGGRIGAYYAKNQFGLTVMPTLRLVVPVGPVEPYVSLGMGYGFIPEKDHADIATMSRLGMIFRFSERFALGLEGTIQKIENSNFRFPSFGSMLTFDL
jgi:hypothetical protein